MSKKYCIVCGKERQPGRKMCRECYLKHKRQYAKERYRTHGRYNYGAFICKGCGKEFTKWHKQQTLCGKCSRNLSLPVTENKYVANKHGRLACEHRRIAESILGSDLGYNRVIHQYIPLLSVRWSLNM